MGVEVKLALRSPNDQKPAAIAISLSLRVLSLEKFSDYWRTAAATASLHLLPKVKLQQRSPD